MELIKNQKLEEIVKNEGYNLNLGVIQKGTNINETIKLQGLGLVHMSISKSCGCTMPTVTTASDGITINITYDNNKVGIINQWVKERYIENGVQKMLTINLKGEIK